MQDARDRQIHRLKKQLRLVEEMVESKTRELFLLNQDLERIVEQRTIQLADALASAEAGNLAKQSFIAHVSHELRTPLHAINGMAEVIGRSAADERLRTRIAVVQAAGSHMLQLVEQLLDLSWLGRGDMPLESVPTDPAEQLRSVVDTLAVRAAQKGLLVRAEVGDLPPAVLCDPTRLREILLNFAGNSLKFTDRGEVVLTATARMAGAEWEVSWSVRDTGCGMDAATVAQVFDPFFQAHDTYKRAHGGAGLGMSIAQRLVQAMGGTVQVESEVGVGTVVRFTTRHAACLAPVVGPVTAAGDRPLGLRVLLVDDQEANCTVGAALLELIGCTAKTTTDPRAVPMLLAAGDIDALLVDYHMPGLDGCELVAALRSAGHRLPMLLASADVGEPARVASAKAGVDGWVGKPFTPAELHAALVAVTGRPTSTTEGSTSESSTTEGCTTAGCTVVGRASERRDAAASDLASESAAAAPTEPSGAANEPLFDLDGALARMGNRVAIVRRVAESFVDSCGRTLAGFAAAAEPRASAHALKGAAASVGAARLAALAARVEHGELEPLTSGTLEQTAAATLAAIRGWLDGLPA